MAGNDWMSYIPNNNLHLREIVMPGSHDAGVSEVHNDWKRVKVPSSWYICQSQDIAGQLNSGARFFDLRFEMKGGTPTTVHETAGVGGWGEDADSIFNSIDNFLQANTREFVIVRVSHTDGTAGRAVSTSQRNMMHHSRYYTAGAQNNLSRYPIRAFRGKAIVAYGSDAIANPDPSIGQIRFGKASNAGRGGIVTCGEFPNSNDMDLIRYKSIKRTNEHRNHNCNNHSHDNHLFMLYWQMTGGDVKTHTTAGGNSPDWHLANAFRANYGTHYNLRYLLRALAGSIGGNVRHAHTLRADSVQAMPGHDNNRINWVPNVINLDFINDEVCASIALFNEATIRLANRWVNAP